MSAFRDSISLSFSLIILLRSSSYCIYCRFWSPFSYIVCKHWALVYCISVRAFFRLRVSRWLPARASASCYLSLFTSCSQVILISLSWWYCDFKSKFSSIPIGLVFSYIKFLRTWNSSSNSWFFYLSTLASSSKASRSILSVSISFNSSSTL